MQRNGLSRLHRLLLSIYRATIKHSGIVLGLAFGVFLLCAYGVTKTNIILTVDDMKDPSFESLGHLTEIKKRFHPGHAAVVIFHKKDLTYFQTEELCQIKNWIELESASNPELDLTISGFDPVKALVLNDRLVYDKVLKLNCQAKSDSTDVLAAFDQTPWSNIVTSSLHNTFNVSLQFRDTPNGTIFGVFDPKPIAELEERISEYFSGSSVTSYIVGTGAFRLHLAKALINDQWINIVFSLLLCVFFRLFLGSWKGGVLILLNVTLVAVILVGTMGLTGASIDMISNSLVIIVMIAAIQDFLFVSYHQMTRRCSFQKSFRVFLLPGFFTSLTTILGFGSLVTSQFSPIRDFGIWAAYGAAVEWIVTFIFTPAFLIKLPKLQIWTAPKKDFLANWTEKIARMNLPKPVFYTFVGLFVFSIPTIFLIEPADEPNDYLSHDHPFNQGVELLKKTHHWDARIYLALKDYTKEAQNRSIIQELSLWDNIETIENPYAVADYVVADQPENIRELIENEFKATPVYYNYFSKDRWTIVRLYLKETSTKIIDTMVSQSKALCPQNECFLADTLVAFTEISHQLIRTMLTSFLLSLAMVSIVIFWLAHQLRIPKVSHILFSSFWGIGIIFLILYLSGVEINYVTVIFAAVLVGIAGDNGIHYLLASKNKGLSDGVLSRGAGSIQIYLTCAGTCLVFLLSSLNSPKVLGLLFFAGFIASLVGDLWILKALERRSKIN